MMTVNDLEQALANTARLVAGVRADQWESSSPCVEWNVRSVTNHGAWVVEMFGAATRGEAPPRPRDTDLLGSDAERAFRSIADSTLQAWRALDSLDGTIVLPIGPVPASAAVGINLLDVYVHGWDIARATDQDANLDDDLCEVALSFARQVVPVDRRDENFAPVVEVGDGAPAAHRLLGYLGRKP